MAVAHLRVVPESAPEPRPLTSFVGREGELARIRQRFVAGARVVTLHGPPGAGKTRLALRHAELREAAPVFVTTIAQLHAAIGERLVIVDDVADPELGQVLVRACAAEPLVRFLVTSSETLGIEGEHVVEVGALAEADARRLFVERARAIDDRFDPSSPHLAEITHLHELPAALERAARMLELYGLDEIAARGHDYAPLAPGWRRLSPREREVALACATCDGPALATIAEVAGFAVGAELARLRRGAWVRASDADGSRRFEMLAQVRAFVLAQFTDAERTRRRERYRPQPRSLPRARLAIGPGARYVVLPSGVRFALGRDTAPRLILQALFAQRPAEVTHEELLQAGCDAGGVRNALAKLRTLGLRDLIVRGDHGYRFAETVDVVEAELLLP